MLTTQVVVFVVKTLCAQHVAGRAQPSWEGPQCIPSLSSLSGTHPMAA